jgi:integrase
MNGNKYMGVRKNRASWWTDFRFGGQRVRKRSPDNSKAGAERYEALLKTRLSKGESLDTPKKDLAQTFATFAQEWFTTHVVTNNKSSTQGSNRMILDGHLLDFFGAMRLDTITASDVERYKGQKLQDDLAAKTINNHLAVLSKCLKSAVEWERVAVAPRIKLLKVPPQRFKHLDRTETARLLDGFVDPRWRVMAVCAVRAGLRMGELIGLRWEDVDFERRQLSVRRSIVRGVVAAPKSNKERHLPMTQDLSTALASLKTKRGYVFQQALTGEPMTRGMTDRALKTACKRSGVRMIGWHVLRHTFASQLATSGISIRIIQELLGHSDMKMTLRYAHLAPSALREAISVLDTNEMAKTEGFGQQMVNMQEKTPKKLSQDPVLERMFLG